jgi:hypothetical protein
VQKSLEAIILVAAEAKTSLKVSWNERPLMFAYQNRRYGSSRGSEIADVLEKLSNDPDVHLNLVFVRG